MDHGRRDESAGRHRGDGSRRDSFITDAAVASTFGAARTCRRPLRINLLPGVDANDDGADEGVRGRGCARVHAVNHSLRRRRSKVTCVARNGGRCFLEGTSTAHLCEGDES